jgi:uncharacterized membrane protein
MDSSQGRPIADPGLGAQPAPRAMPARGPAERVGFGRRLRRYFLTGLVAILPLGLVAFILWRVFFGLDRLLGQFFDVLLGFRVPGAGFVALILLILGIGAVAHNFVGRRLIRVVEDFVIHIPFVRWIYRTTKEFSSAILEEKSTSFRKVVFVEFPFRGVYSIGFQTADSASDVSKLTGKRLISVFIPTAPNPMTGFVILYPEEDVISLPMSVDDGLRFVISAGALSGRGPQPPERG